MLLKRGEENARRGRVNAGGRGFGEGAPTGFHRTWIDQNRRVRGSPIGAGCDETCQGLGGCCPCKGFSSSPVQFAGLDSM
jgi:hypothetical protein